LVGWRKGMSEGRNGKREEEKRREEKRRREEKGGEEGRKRRRPGLSFPPQTAKRLWRMHADIGL